VKPEATRQFYAFQRDVEGLVESADYKTPAIKLPDFVLYDPARGETSCDETTKTSDWMEDVFSSAVTGIFGAIVGTYLMRLMVLTQWRGLGRRLLTCHLGSSPRTVHNYRTLRTVFNTTQMHGCTAYDNHSHGIAAAARRTAVNFMDAVCTTAGLTRYSYQMSQNEQAAGVPGERTYYWAKDVTAEPQFDVPTEDHCVTMVDVDFHINDLSDLLAMNAKPHMLYTVQPETAGVVRDDYSYSFNKAGELHFVVNGGAVYHHKIWNFGTDILLATRTFMGVPYKAVLYDVHSKRLSEDKQVVLLAPIRLFYGFSAILASFMAPLLHRLNPIVGDYVKVVVRGTTGKAVSIAKCDTETSCTIPSYLFDSLISARNVSPKQHVNTYQVKSQLANISEDLDHHQDILAPILTEYLNNAPDRVIDPIFVMDTPTIIQVAFSVPDPTDTPNMVAFAKPFGVPPGFVPINNKDSTDQSIKGRVLLPRMQVESVLGGYRDTPMKTEAMNEFVRRLVPDPHVGVPYDGSEIEERQTKPSQKQDYSFSGMLGLVKNVVTTFMKAEVYDKPTDPRNITTFNAKIKIEYAAFMYPIMDHLKKFECYAFGVTPLKIANRVADICKRSSSVACPDITRMDGFVNNFCRRLETAVGRRFFRLEHGDCFDSAHKHAWGNKGITTHGLVYQQEESRGSGEMGTSAWNTIINLFMLFLAKYMECRDFDGAWEWLMRSTVAGGDDSVAGDIDDATLIRAARDIGFILKCPIYHRGDVGVNFLARVYGPYVWEGDANSMCSLRRQMQKLHLTKNVPLSAEQKLYEKALSFSMTDANTPLIGCLVRKVLGVASGFRTTKSLARWGDDIPIEDQYPNENSGWMREVACGELPLTHFQEFEDWLEGSTSWDDLLNCPTFYDEGREFTFDAWDAESGILIAKTLDVLAPKRIKMAPSKDVKPVVVDHNKPGESLVNVAEVKFGTYEPLVARKDKRVKPLPPKEVTKSVVLDVVTTRRKRGKTPPVEVEEKEDVV
jgi:hypothetical protein